MKSIVELVIVALVLSGCGGKKKDSTDDADADVTDVVEEDEKTDVVDDPTDVPEDTGTDGGEDAMEEDTVGPPPSDWYCRACTWDSECGPGGECVPLADADWSCATVCDGDEDCPEGARCESRTDGVTRCVPNTGACVYDSLGSDCPAWGCSGREHLCSDPAGADGYCTHECTSQADCHEGYNLCADRGDGVMVCMLDPPSPFERCASTVHDDGIGSPCSSSTCADAIFLCSDTVSDEVPAFCTFSCTEDDQCGDGTCASLQGTDGSTRYCVPDECLCLDVVPGSMLDTALQATDLTRCDLGWPEESVTPRNLELTHDRFRLPWFDDVHNDWLRGGAPMARALETGFDTSIEAGSAEVLEQAASWGGHPIEGGDVTFTPDATEPLVAAVAAILEHLGETPEMDSIRTDASDVPEDVREAAAVVLLAALQGIQAREQAVEGTIGHDEFQVRLFFMKTPGFVNPLPGTGLDPTDRQVQDLLIGDYGYEQVYQAAYGIARAVEQADLGSLAVGTEEFSFDVATPAGRIIISDAGDDVYEGDLTSEDILLLLDMGGDDTYRVSAGGNSSHENPVSICIDVTGTDRYGYVEVPHAGDTGTRLVSDEDGRAGSPNPAFSLSDHARQGSGRMGIGMLYDLGDTGDAYQSLRMSQGFGSLGVGLLWDAGGDDDYLCEASCQGAGIFGLGIMVDRGAGTDTHEAYHASQGFAYSGAVGLLHDGGGPDSYLCNQDDVLYTSAQHDLSNSSLCQGMGFGRRADIAYGGDGVFMSGGLGILRDLAGDDTYEAAVFAQGTGYWFAMGALLDGDGNDRYDARWYIQGAGAHYANGLLHDAAGNDHYNEFEDTRLNVSLGGGHDYSIAVFLDDAGDDTYMAPNLSFGAGNDDGFGLFLDRDGTDSYQCSSDFSFGNAVETVRALPLSVGIFLEAGGSDTYDRPDTTLTVNGGLWTQTRSGGASEHGAGMDVDTGGIPGY